MSAPGSARLTSPRSPMDAATPPVVGSVSTVTHGTRACLSRVTAAVTLAICMSEKMPSWRRAPPEAVQTTSGTRAARACSMRRVRRSPTPVPMLPPRKAKSKTASATRCPPMRAVPVRIPARRAAAVALLDEPADRAADDHRVRKAGDPAHLLGGADAEAYAHGEPRRAPHAADQLRQLGRQRGAGARRAEDRDEVEEAAGRAGDRAQAGGRRGGREERDQVEAGGAGGRAQVLRLLRRQVDAEEPVGASRRCVGRDPLDPVAKERVVVAEEHDRLTHL